MPVPNCPLPPAGGRDPPVLRRHRVEAGRPQGRRPLQVSQHPVEACQTRGAQGRTDCGRQQELQVQCVKCSAVQCSAVQCSAVLSYFSSANCFAIDDVGQVWAWGRNESGQLGLGDQKDRQVPTLVPAISGYEVVEVASGKLHTLFLTSCGKVGIEAFCLFVIKSKYAKVFAAGSNDDGQCGQVLVIVT